MPQEILYVGHSLVGTTMPSMLADLLPSTDIDAQIINGASLAYNWDHGAGAQGVNARAVLPSGRYDVLILTEAIPLAGNIQWSDTYGVAADYATLAWNANANTRVLVYETWHELTNQAAWRAALNSDLALWRGIADSLNEIKPNSAPQVGIVPGGQALARLYDAIDVGRGQGLTNINQVFSDQIHLNDIGNYLIALVQAATISGKTSVGLTYNLSNDFGVAYDDWTADQANLLQHLAWEAAATAPGALLAPNTTLPRLINGTGGVDNLVGGAGDDRIYGANGNDVLQGKSGHDLMQGENGNDNLRGTGGNDWLYGDAGNDSLRGDAGNDRLSGGTGNDSLTGGDGADSFVFSKAGGADRIVDFKTSQGDLLILSDDIWTGSLSESQIVSRYATVTSQGVLLDFGASGTLLLVGLTTTSGLAAQIDII